MDQPVISITTTVREDVGRGGSVVMASKPIRKTSSFEREGWWRIALTNTPIPGTYHLKTFIEDSLSNPVAATYNFKNEGRKKPPLVQRNNPILNDLPQYMPPDFLDLLKKQVATYSFKDKPRSSPSTLVYKDQSVKLSPGQYDLLPAPVPKYASRSFVFRSTVQRFPTSYFTPREGPGPGHYDLKIPSTTSVSSCFRSKVPRFLPACSKTPGPGAYTSSAQFPRQPRTIAKMGREHSLFFNNTVGF
ncbi:protein STPG4 [Rousettus aegyptiacus]|uniref:Sperm-tail PG-rich repeat containing 4 n=1 Tax=Rousettus aegyptiacus TaxID=9407 RepID=A0A7J8FMZ5_ROUAE|nr:protein STPG4 [Rousettus aegyptiacus]KAF6449036.1 sperm-tail PG-rich repeat containing 4 [Rousettus aegyptiacus]